MKRLLMIIIAFAIVGCTEKHHYVYIDFQGIIHAKQGCKAVSKIHNAQPIRAIPITDVRPFMLHRVCSQCVDESTLTALEEIANANGKGTVQDSIAAYGY